MAPFQSRNRPVPKPPARSIPVIAVGKRVFVHCLEGRSGSVALEDETGRIFSSVHLADGLEVEVVAWRPRIAGDAQYRVRAPSNGADGWLPAVNLRWAPVPVPTAEASQPSSAPMQATSVADGLTRPFGQRSHTRQTITPGFPTPANPVLPSDADGRRFGQHFEAARTPASSPTPVEPDHGGDTGGRRFGRHN